jgi:hypothetical protein
MATKVSSGEVRSQNVPSALAATISTYNPIFSMSDIEIKFSQKFSPLENCGNGMI